MFDSGISVKNLIDELKNTEVDIALDIPNKTYVEWLNSLQQLLYTEVIKEQKKATFQNPHIMIPHTVNDYFDNPDGDDSFFVPPEGDGDDNYFDDLVPENPLINKISIKEHISVDDSTECMPRFEDIHAVYADGMQLIKSTLTSGVIFPNTFYKDNNDIGYNATPLPTNFTIVYIVKPALVTVNNVDEINDANVMLPVEFIDLAKAKLRGEAYKLANEDSLAAKWLNDYNILLETFKAWISEKSSNFGM